MIRLYRSGCTACEGAEIDVEGWTLPADTLWVDLIEPTREEDMAIEKALGLSIPTREEMNELEASSRLYRENGATYVTADILHNAEAELPTVDPVTFILTHGPLVTIRYFDPRPFTMFTDKLEREPSLCDSGADMFLNLVEAIIDRASDVLSKTAHKVDGVASHVFSGTEKTVGFQHLITKLGRAQIANSRIEQSLSGLARVFAFVSLDERLDMIEDKREHLRSLGRDAASLLTHNQAVAAGITFQLSATLGLINIQQSSIFKVFSLFTVALMPPTLIGAVYGMNFDLMPELTWTWGYPLALLLMAVSSALPLLWFKRKGWF
ncbi:magnesium transporter CorA family protein [Brevundimonas aurifodinae]|uniref:Magnesium transporter CorA family protein n=2 Tax=Brevundimonas TaxID=41275 RepID=A0ABV1NQR9_9CAUL|nr:MAG: magnesium transporter [Brevundimonas sp. 12-68-7]OYX33429.1 MAG: magnesium transporter [Brevundimonas subvibrioides]